ncbi:hypothetical protein [Pelagibacterium xiamenense]|uniref:hypothetical protein n=1 Tax=Pelagibacterium xiamenense TaxID=2901140 RepID=UPI001E284535|nr:hypothetical protein [Pelagibacterium xiamenense]MCD7061258.1 hypothetical protein [Pelagibacterium xiamenense]
MAIGQVTISAADWIAARVTDRMAIMAAASRIDEQSQLSGNIAVPPTEENAQSQLDQRRRQHSLLAAQESYRRVAARIKARLASRPQSETVRVEDALRPSAERARLLEVMRDNPKLLTTLIAGTADTNQTQPAKTAARVDAVPAPFGAGQTKPFEPPPAQESTTAQNTPDGGPDSTDTLTVWETAEARADAIAADTALRKGLWADLFEAVDKPTDHRPIVED